MPRLIRRYIFSTDHKVIGLQYGFTSLFFLLVGFSLVMLIRWQQAFPAQPIPLVGGWLGQANAPGGVLLPEFYNQLGAMHGTIMVFLGVVPLAFGGMSTEEAHACFDLFAAEVLPELKKHDVGGDLGVTYGATVPAALTGA